MFGPTRSSHEACSLGLAARWITVSTPWNIVIHSSSYVGQVGRDHVGVVGVGRRVDQDEVVLLVPGRPELGPDVAAGPRDQDGPGAVVDVLAIVVGIDPDLIVFVIVVIEDGETVGLRVSRSSASGFAA